VCIYIFLLLSNVYSMNRNRGGKAAAAAKKPSTRSKSKDKGAGDGGGVVGEGSGKAEPEDSAGKATAKEYSFGTLLGLTDKDQVPEWRKKKVRC
jgi:hypothetical protein